MCYWWIKAQYLRYFMNPIRENCYVPMSMIYWPIPLLNLKLVIAKILAVVCVCFFLLFVCFVIFKILVYSLDPCSYWSDIICSFFYRLIQTLLQIMRSFPRCTSLLSFLVFFKQHYSATLHLIISNSQVIQRQLLFNCVFAVNTLFGLGPKCA